MLYLRDGDYQSDLLQWEVLHSQSWREEHRSFHQEFKGTVPTFSHQFYKERIRKEFLEFLRKIEFIFSMESISPTTHKNQEQTFDNIFILKRIFLGSMMTRQWGFWVRKVFSTRKVSFIYTQWIKLKFIFSFNFEIEF